MNDSRHDDNPDRDRDPAADPASSPWRQPVIWLVIALVAAAVIGGISMIVIASGDGATDSVAADVSRTAQVQTADLGPDAVARQEKLSAIMRVDAEAGAIEVLPVGGRFDRDAPLRLSLHHPTLAERDQVLELQPTELGWRAGQELDGSHDWNLTLAPADGRWRLQGRLPKGQLATHLHPALQAPQ